MGATHSHLFGRPSHCLFFTGPRRAGPQVPGLAFFRADRVSGGPPDRSSLTPHFLSRKVPYRLQQRCPPALRGKGRRGGQLHIRRGGQVPDP